MKALEIPTKLRRSGNNKRQQRIVTIPWRNLEIITKTIGVSVDEITDSVFILKLEKVILMDGRTFDFSERLNGDQGNPTQ